MAAVLTVTTPDDVKFTVDDLFGQNNLAKPLRAFRALRENVDRCGHEKWEKDGTGF